jgi:hypothetical protein
MQKSTEFPFNIFCRGARVRMRRSEYFVQHKALDSKSHVTRHTSHVQSRNHLQLRVVDAYAAAAQLKAVENKVICMAE